MKGSTTKLWVLTGIETGALVQLRNILVQLEAIAFLWWGGGRGASVWLESPHQSWFWVLVTRATQSVDVIGTPSVYVG